MQFGLGSAHRLTEAVLTKISSRDNLDPREALRRSPPENMLAEQESFRDYKAPLDDLAHANRRFMPSLKASRPERRKVVLHNPWKRFGFSCVVHLIPVSVFIGVIWLDRTHYFWFEDERPVIMNLLQFAAKLQELFIIASLSAMALHHARNHLIGVRGLPFGLLSAAYRVADVELLTQSAFWSSVLDRGSWRLGIFIAFSVALSALVGPSAAIALLPNAGFYHYPNAFANSTSRLLFFPTQSILDSIYIENKFETIWPSSLTNETYDWTECTENYPNFTTFRRCPARSYVDTLEWPWEKVGGQYASVYEPTSRFVYEAITSVVNKTDGSPISRDVKGAPTVIAVSSSPNENVIRAVGKLWRNIKGDRTALNYIGPVANASTIRLRSSASSPIFQHTVQTQCNWLGDSRNAREATLKLLGNRILSFKRDIGWHIDSDAEWVVPQVTIDNVLKRSVNAGFSDQHFVEWIEPKAVNANGSFSIAALISAPISVQELDDLRDQDARLLISCTISTHWMPSTFSLDPQSLIQVQTNWTGVSNPMAAAIRATEDKEDPNSWLPNPLELMHIDNTWVKALEVRNTEQDGGVPWISKLLTEATSGSISNIYYPLINASSADPDITWLMTRFTTGVSTALTVALANFGSDPLALFLTSKENTISALVDSDDLLMLTGVDGAEVPKLFANIYELGIDVDRYGYAYGAGTSTLTFAFVVVYIYLSILVLYAAYALWDYVTVHPPAISSWGKLQDIIALAMNSLPPPQLENCGAGVQSSHTWSQRIKIRADDNSRLHFSFMDRPDWAELEWNKKYG